ncbi:MAG: HAMP domain-containing histidine kinase [Flavobacteriales bacterium]|nr:HAMP domain-containing histidine kinase [Flavobacteriales bacterium]
MQPRRGTLNIIYILSIYVVLQLFWWGYHIIQLTQASGAPESVQRRVWMILGEGSVFVIILGIGIFKLRQLYKREEASRDKEKNFLLAVTHELKTPIASNRLALETIKNRKLTPELNAKMITNALNSNVRLEELVDKILLSSNLGSRSQSSTETKFNLNVELDRIVRYNCSALESLIKVETHLGEECYINMNLMEFETMISNLIQNAIKYQGDGDRIVIRSKLVNGAKVNVSIADNGPGIPNSEKQKVFEKFYRIGDEMTRETKGTGLGLFLVKELALRNKGQINIQDNDPTGSIFTLTFPILSK